MSKLYDDVKKQGEQIDDLQKKVTGHDTRIETLETQAMATPTNSDAPMPNVTVSIPDNIATTENISDLVDDAIERNTEVMTNAITQLYTTVLPKQSAAEPSPAAISNEQIRKIAQEAADKASEKAMNIRYDKLDAAADTVMHRLYNLVNGAIWAAIPKWVYVVFAVAVLAAGGFGYGFFYLLNENSKLKDVEWLYRYERGLNRDLNVVMHRERQMLHGTSHEVDSLKSLIRHHEQRTNADTTFIYFYPSNL
ncbi:hypothetical protein [Xylanibacter rodentium]|uniref:hypothetical protein n=1 Tax=Xylanibacter rodentium TaxID=2736289 RepID=UPI002587F042|nr:hypothetical protein [Xylanibacter rodentium]